MKKYVVGCQKYIYYFFLTKNQDLLEDTLLTAWILKCNLPLVSTVLCAASDLGFK